MSKKEVIIGLTYGDPAGIGPEIIDKTLKTKKLKYKTFVIGNKEIIKKFKKNKKIITIETKTNIKKISTGKPSIQSGLDSYESLKLGCEYGEAEKISTLITGPVSKYAINLAGKKFNGQTDELAKLCNIKSKNVIMIFIAKDFRLSLFTRHIPLKKVFKYLTKKNLEHHINLLNKELTEKLKIKNPRIAVLGLNPHASENGLFGDEENNIISPVIKKLKKLGLSIEGPFPADATLAKAGKVYLEKKKQPYDAYISIYHDQGLPMFKAITDHNGVNVTLGLPFLRVSVDHGTAFDIAGKNIASNKGLISAIEFVEHLHR